MKPLGTPYFLSATCLALLAAIAPAGAGARAANPWNPVAAEGGADAPRYHGDPAGGAQIWAPEGGNAARYAPSDLDAELSRQNPRPQQPAAQGPMMSPPVAVAPPTAGPVLQVPSANNGLSAASRQADNPAPIQAPVPYFDPAAGYLPLPVYGAALPGYGGVPAYGYGRPLAGPIAGWPGATGPFNLGGFNPGWRASPTAPTPYAGPFTAGSPFWFW